MCRATASSFARLRYPHPQSDDQRSTPRTRYPRLYVQSDSQPSCQASLPTHTERRPAFYVKDSLPVYSASVSRLANQRFTPSFNSGCCTQRFTPVIQHPMMLTIKPLETGGPSFRALFPKSLSGGECRHTIAQRTQARTVTKRERKITKSLMIKLGSLDP